MPGRKRKTTVALISLGCPKNLVDAEVMLGLLEAAGYRLVAAPEEAEVLVVNTCAFIEPAVEEALDALLDLGELKRSGSLRALVCSGCLPQRYGEELLEELPEVDVFLGPGAMPHIVEAVGAALRGERRLIRAPLDYLYAADTPRVRTGAEWAAYVKIAEGCDHRCAYCTVPALRGAYRSRLPEDVQREVKRLAAEGVREMVLIAQDTSYYGRDLHPRRSLAELLRGLGEVLGTVCADSGVGAGGELPWLRLMYLHPAHLTRELLEAMAATPGVVPYLDLPLQHAAPAVLRRMGRAGSGESYLRLIRRIRQDVPGAALRTTFIVGFPGETEADFQELLEFVEQARFDRLSAFRYWPEEGTPAATLPDQVPLEVADERLEALLQAQEKLSLANNQALIGQRLRVLVEQVEADEAVGRSYRDAPEVDGVVKVLRGSVDRGEWERMLQPGRFVEAEVIAVEPHDLMARVGIQPPER